MNWQEPTSRNEVIRFMDKALTRFQNILLRKPISGQLGSSFTYDDIDLMMDADSALSRLKPGDDSFGSRLETERAFQLAGKALRKALILLNREGFKEHQSEGDEIGFEKTHCDADVSMIRQAHSVYMQATAHSRN